MGHGHHHGHGAHAHPQASTTRTFAWVTLINLAYTAIEAGYGFHTNSLALLSDALHNLGEVRRHEKDMVIRYEDGVAALQAGASGFTHLFNAMSGLHQREPGISVGQGAKAGHCGRAVSAG